MSMEEEDVQARHQNEKQSPQYFSHVLSPNTGTEAWMIVGDDVYHVTYKAGRFLIHSKSKVSQPCCLAVLWRHQVGSQTAKDTSLHKEGI